MESGTPQSSNKLHPAIWVAIVSVTAFSAVGIGSMTGLIPNFSKKADAPPAPVAQTAQLSPVAAVAPPPEVKPAEKPVAAKPAEKKHQYKSVDKSSHSPQYASAAPSCKNCGVIESVNEIVKPGEGSGLGVVAGGVLGGVLGNQVGKGHGRQLATVAGMAGGAYAGNEIEKSQRKSVSYEIVVRFNDSTRQTFRQTTAPGWRQGDGVRVENGVIVSR